jgi:lysyl-tRNA synthetase, class II
MSRDRPSLSRSLTVRQSAALGVAAAGLEAALLAGARSDPVHRRLVARLAPAALPTPAHLLVLLVGILLVAVAPRLWRGTRAAVRLAVGLLCVVAVLNLVRGFEFAPVVDIGLAAVLFAGRGAFPLGSSNRTHPVLVAAGVATWALACLAVSVVTPRLSDGWQALIEILIATAVAVSVLAVRALLAPAPGGKGHGPREHRAARAIAWQYGEDSLSPFTLRADKALHFASHGVLAYRVFGETAVISGDPIAPAGAAPLVLASFLALARSRGWQVAVWGASARYLDAYRQLGLRVAQAGEEGFVDPGRFTLEGRRVRKLRQSVHRVARRGWQMTVCEGRDFDAELEAEVDALESAWKAGRRRLLGFAMGMGAFAPELRPDDMFVLARSPGGELRAVMRFAAHSGRLSLDTMRRVGETPNGLIEAMMCRGLEAADELDVPEVSLNYAGLAHLVRAADSGGRGRKRMTALMLRMLGSRFQLERLVRFNEKFFPEWRPRFLIYQSRATLPRTILRVLQAEGYISPPRLPRPAARWHRPPTRNSADSAPANAAG